MKQPSSEDSDPIKILVILGDFILLNISMILTYILLERISPQAVSGIPLKFYLLLANLYYIPCISAFGVILQKRIVRPEKIVTRLLCTIGLHFAIFMATLAIMKTSELPRTYILCFYLGFTVLLTGYRLSLRALVKAYRRRGGNLRNVVLIGDGDNMTELYSTLTNQTYGYHIIGIFYDGKEMGYPSDIPYRGAVREAIKWIRNENVQEVYCGLPSNKKKDILEIINYCENNLIRYYSVPHVRNYIKRQLVLDMKGDVPVLSIRKEPLLDPRKKLIKRTFDIVSSTLFLVCIFPWMLLIIGTLIKLSSKGPIFFTQERSGKDGKIFKCYKFRSMRVNDVSDSLQATSNDPRKTKVGNFLRKTNLDEFPQFINVFKGDMSVVGPRPHMLKHTQEYSQIIDKYMMRHLIKPGITGWAQVNGYRGETKKVSQMEGRVRHDLWYIENWSFLLDIRIIIKTFTKMLHGEKNAY